MILMNKKLLLQCVALTLIVFTSDHVARAAVFNIPNGDIAALKNAITSANGNGQADTINLAGVGTYTLTAVDNSMSGANGLPVIGNDVAGVDLTINGNGATIQRNDSPGAPEFRILQVDNGTVNVSNLTIVNGKVSGGFPAAAGAGILNSQSTLNLTDCTIRANNGGVGGGLFNDGVATLHGCIFDINHATDVGGGIANNGELTLFDTHLDDNTTDHQGAGIHNLGTARLERCILQGNRAHAAGGGVHNLGALTVESSTFNQNQTLAEGGAVSTYLNTSSPSSMTLLNSTFSDNVATYGGGVSNIGGTLLLRNCTVHGNSAAHAGGLYNLSGSSTVQSTTFTANTSPDVGGIYNLNTVGPATLRIRNTILQSGATGSNIANVNGVVTSEGHNLSSDPAGGGNGSGPDGLLNGLGDIRNTSANLGPLQNNGGPTLTHALLSTSAAVDAGDDAVLDAPIGLTSDQRGPGFTRRKGLHVDIGAVESGVSLIVTTVDDHNDGTCTLGDCTLREAITSINLGGGGDVSFAAGVRGTIQLTSALPTISTNLFLQGPGANLLTVRRNSGGNYRIFTISNGTIDGPDALITGLTINNGQAPAVAFPNSSGGGVLNDHGSLWIDRCRLSGNSSFLPADTYGGGIFNNEGDLTVTESTVSGNSSRFGGGIASRRTVAGTAHAQVVSSTISGNNSDGGRGGGIYNESTNVNSSATVSFLNCTLSGNSVTSSISGDSGGAIFNGGSFSGNAQALIEDCTFSGNNANSAGAIYNNNFSASALVTVRNTIFQTGAIGDNIINSSGAFVSLGHNLSNDAAGGLPGTGPGGYLSAASDVRQTDPMLGVLQANGGRTFTHALINGSPAINAGEDTDESNVDQRGYARLGTNDIGAFESGGVSPAPPVVSAVSRKLHGGTPFDINLPLTGDAGVECRSSGGSNDYQIVVTFANSVAVTGSPQATVISGAATIGTGGVANGGAVAATGTVVTIPLTNVTNAQFIEVRLTSVNDGINIGDVVIPMGVLIGDTTGNGSVNASDVSQTKSRSGQAISVSNFRSDVTANGSINASDIGAVKSKSGTALED
jgi:fibronectin-binding autotransporter adhesin